MMSLKSKQTVLTLGLLAALGINASWSPLSTSSEQVAHMSQKAAPSGPHASLAAKAVKEGEPEAAGKASTAPTDAAKAKTTPVAQTTATTVKPAAPVAAPKANSDRNVNPPPVPTEKPAPPTATQNAEDPAPEDPANAALQAVDTSVKKAPAPAPEAPKVAAAAKAESAPALVEAAQKVCTDKEVEVIDPTSNETIKLHMYCGANGAWIYNSQDIEGKAFPLKDNGELCVSCLPNGTPAVMVKPGDTKAFGELVNALIAKLKSKKVEELKVAKEEKKDPTPCIKISDKLAKAQCYAEQLEALASEDAASKLETTYDRPWERTNAVLLALKGDSKDFPGLKGLASAMEELKKAAGNATTEEASKDLAEAADRILEAYKEVKDRYRTSSLGEGYKSAKDALANARTLEKILPAEKKLADIKEDIEKKARSLVAEEAQVDACFANQNRSRMGYSCDMQELRLQQKKWALQNQATQQIASNYNTTNNDLIQLFSRLGVTQRESLMPRVYDLETAFNDRFMDYTLNFDALINDAGRGSSGNSRLGSRMRDGGTRVRDSGSRLSSGRYGVPRSSVANTGARDVIQTSDGTYVRVNGGSNGSNGAIDQRMRSRDAVIRSRGGQTY